VTIGASSTDVTINADTVTLTSAGGTETLVNDGTGQALAVKGLTAGTGVSLSSTSSAVTITNSDPASGVTLTNAGTTTLVNDGTGPALATKGLVAGNYISFSTSSTDVTITGDQYPTITDVCIVTNNANILINNGAQSALTFNTEVLDPSGMHSTSMNTDRINILADGLYLIQGSATWQAQAGTTGIVALLIYLVRSSTTYDIGSAACASPAGQNERVCFGRVFSLLNGDYLTLQAFNSSGANKNVLSQTSGGSIYASPLFSVTKLGTA
jgi:hypothetical protein